MGVLDTQPVVKPPKPMAPPKPAALNPQQDLREFGDAIGTRNRIYDEVLKAAQGIKPLTNQRHTLQLRDVDYADEGVFDIQKQKEAILSGKTLGRRLVGTWDLVDNATQQVLDSKKATLARVPFMTERGTFIHNGSEYTLSNQVRLRPGVFTRVKDNGEIEAHANILPGKGVSHRYFLDPAKGIFYVRFGQAKIPLMPLLRALGAKDRDLQEAWGPELWEANAQKDDPGTLNKLYTKLIRRTNPDAPPEEKLQSVKEFIEKMEVDPEVMERTLGKNYGNLNLESLLATTKKLLAVSRGEQEVDDRDHLAYQNLLGPEDLFAERIAKDYGGIRRNLFYKSSFRGDLGSFQPGILTKQIEAALLNSGLGQNLEDINLAEVLDKQTKVTRLGEGGIPSVDSVPDEARSVQPSHFGFIDPVRTPECYSSDSEVLTRDGWKYWTEVTAEDLFACLVDGKVEYHKPIRLIREAYSGDLICGLSNFIDYQVTPNHRMYTCPYDYFGEDKPWRFEFAEQSYGKSRYFKTGGHAVYQAASPLTSFKLPEIVRNQYDHSSLRYDSTIDMSDWLEFLGWYLSEGSCEFDEGTSRYSTSISQSAEVNPDAYDRIAGLLSRLPFNCTVHTDGSGFQITGKQLASYLIQFGNSYDKYIPTYVFEATTEGRRRFVEAMLLGDGRRDKRGELAQLCTCSKRLANDFQRLLFDLGYASRISFEPEKRFEDCPGCYVVNIHKVNARLILNRSGNKMSYTRPYNDWVYCAEVPGSLLYVRRNNSVGYWSGNSSKAGVDAFITNMARKGRDGRVYAPFLDLKGQTVWKSPQDLATLTVAFPGEMKRKTKRVGAMVGGKLKFVPRDQVDLVLPHFEGAFSPLGNMIPMKSAVKAQRMAMASRMTTQALPLDQPESPLVRAGIPGDDTNSYEKLYGRSMGAVFADKPGRVLAIDKNSITIKYNDGSTEKKQLYYNFPSNRKTFTHNDPVVKVGDVVQAGQTLAKSSYTDAEGVTALGKNLYAAYLPFKGMNFEDALVISESAAKKMASTHMYQHAVDWAPEHRKGRSAFVSLFPGKYDRKTLATIDADGIIKEGTVVNYGDPLILAARQKERAHGKIHRKREAAFSDQTETWKHHSPGIVTDVYKTPKGVNVLVKSLAETQVGDKISGRYGDKGVIAGIIPDDQMPTDKEGRAFEILLNPLGIISRTNPAQMVEAALGKIAAKTGKPYNVPDFDNIDDLTEFAIKELEKHGVSDLEDVTDPATQRKIKNIFTGNRFFMKLHHTSESKGQGRGIGGYTMDATPAKGGETGSKTLGLLDSNAILSHGAYSVLHDASAIRGQRNEEFWLPFMQGLNPPKPKVPFIYERFVNELKAAGINVVREGHSLNIMALTDKDIDKLAGDRYLTSGDTVQFEKGMKPIAGGLFDPTLTGGNNGNRWAAIKLEEPMPNPVMEEPIRRLLGLTQKDFENVIAGKKELKGDTGTHAIVKALKSLDLDKEIEVARANIKSGRATIRDAAVRKLGYLKSAKKLGIHPSEWLLTKAPVLPPAFRPVSVMSDSKLPLVADANYLYKELLEANDNLKEMKKEVSDVGEERLAVYHAFKAVTGLGDPVHPKLQEKRIKGVLKHIFGNSPKFGAVQRRLLSNTVDLVGRAVITPNPDLDMDHVGLPENRAWDVYKNFIVRRLRRRGMPLLEAARQVENRGDLAKQELLREMEERPVIINRAPVLHRFGVMAFYPKLVKGDTLQISPLVVKGFNADFDGDAMQYHVPVSDEARQEAIDRMLPSRNLLSPADFKSPTASPSQEYTGGLYQATATKSGKRPQVFRNIKDVLAAFRRGEIDINDPIEILS